MNSPMIKVPVIAIGTSFCDPNKIISGIQNAIKAGYRHIDICQVDRHELQVGEGIKRAIDQGIVKRNELFITVKLWNTYLDPFQVEKGLDLMLKDLKLKYVDMLMMQFPTAFKNQGNPPSYDTSKERFLTIPLSDTWEAFEIMVRIGKAKNIGIANFNKEQIMEIQRVARGKPIILQIESNPIFPNHEMVDFCNTQALGCYSFLPFGHPEHELSKSLMSRPEIIEIANELSKTPSQICLKYCLQRGLGIIVDTTDVTEQKEYFNIFDFNIDVQGMFRISNAIEATRTATYADIIGDHVKYPFN